MTHTHTLSFKHITQWKLDISHLLMELPTIFLKSSGSEKSEELESRRASGNLLSEGLSMAKEIHQLAFLFTICRNIHGAIMKNATALNYT